MIKVNDYIGWEHVPEETIVDAVHTAESMGNNPAIMNDKDNFRRILAAGGMFKQAGLTPIYVWCDSTHRLAVYADELYGKKLH